MLWGGERIYLTRPVKLEEVEFRKVVGIALKDRLEAYDQIEPKRPNRKAMILDVLTSGDPGGMTADEIGEKLVSEGKIPTNSPNFTRPRLTEMKAEGKVVIVGRRPGKSGCNTAVWKVKR